MHVPIFQVPGPYAVAKPRICAARMDFPRCGQRCPIGYEKICGPVVCALRCPVRLPFAVFGWQRRCMRTGSPRSQAGHWPGTSLSDMGVATLTRAHNDGGAAARFPPLGVGLVFIL